MYVALLGEGPFYEKVLKELFLRGFEVVTDQSKFGRTRMALAANLRTVLSPEQLSQWPEGVFGYHPSLLPRHRGPDAVRATIAAGDNVAGGSVYLFDAGTDTGPVLLQKMCKVRPEWDANALYRNELFPIGVELLVLCAQMARRFGRNGRRLRQMCVPQNETEATRHAPGGWPQWYERSRADAELWTRFQKR